MSSSTGNINKKTSSSPKALPQFEDSDFYLNLDDIILGTQIGQGAFSKVFIGKYMGELVAVKKQRRAPNDGLDTYLLRELSLLKHYEHPNLLSYIGASDVPGEGIGGANAIYIITELAEHGDLLGLLLDPTTFGWKIRVSILLDASRALEFLHCKSLIHRDIKSPNMLLDKNFTCKIADFGMAREIGSNMTIVGTDAYMAPELMFDEEYDTSADMFSFGIVIWETIYRKKAGQDNFALRVPKDRYKLDIDCLGENSPKDVNPSLITLASQLCDYDPSLRPSAEDTFLWLEDLYNDMEDDHDIPKVKPIDYGTIFSSEKATNLSKPKPKPPSLSNVTLGTTVNSTWRPPTSSSSNSDLKQSKSPSNVNQNKMLISKNSSRSSSVGSFKGAAHAPITKSGFLHKKGKSGMKTWQKRWFVLEGTKLIWYKDSRSFPKEPRGYLELKGCFIVRGLYFRWKILSADQKASQDDYNRDFSAKDVLDMEQWLTALQTAIDAADTGENLPTEQQLSPPFNSHNLSFEQLDRGISIRSGEPVCWSNLRTQSVDDWLESLNLSRLSKNFEEGGYDDLMLIQELGLQSKDLNHLKIKDKKERKILKLASNGAMAKELAVEVSGFLNFASVIVYRLDSRWRSLRASTFFTYEDFEELHRKIYLAIKDSKYGYCMPELPTVTTQSMLTYGTFVHAAEMARMQQDLNKYITRLVMVAKKEPYFTLLCGQLDLLPPDPMRLPDLSDDFMVRTGLQNMNSESSFSFASRSSSLYSGISPLRMKHD